MYSCLWRSSASVLEHVCHSVRVDEQEIARWALGQLLKLGPRCGSRCLREGPPKANGRSLACEFGCYCLYEILLAEAESEAAGRRRHIVVRKPWNLTAQGLLRVHSCVDISSSRAASAPRVRVQAQAQLRSMLQGRMLGTIASGPQFFNLRFIASVVAGPRFSPGRCNGHGRQCCR